MADKFYTQQCCDRCGRTLKDGRIMSMFDTDCICMRCAAKERKLPEYKLAQYADREQIKRGNYNFEGIGYPVEKRGERK